MKSMEEKTYFHRVNELTPTLFWINNVTQEEAKRALAEGACGCTQNPAYVWKMMQRESELPEIQQLIMRLRDQGVARDQILIAVLRELVGRIAKLFLPLYQQSQGRWGYVSIQGDPFHEDCDSIVKTGLFNREAGENIMIKIPVTEEGLKAISILAAQGVPINATEVMSVRQAMDVGRVYAEATSHCVRKAPIYYSHITGILDEYLYKTVQETEVAIASDVLFQAGIAATKKTYAMTRTQYPDVGFIGGGARGLHHFTEMVGAQACVTINWKGTADQLIDQNPPVIERFAQPTPPAVLDELLEKLPDFRKSYCLHAIEPSEYEAFGPVVLFRSSFESAWKQAQSLIDSLIG